MSADEMNEKARRGLNLGEGPSASGVVVELPSTLMQREIAWMNNVPCAEATDLVESGCDSGRLPKCPTGRSLGNFWLNSMAS